MPIAERMNVKDGVFCCYCHNGSELHIKRDIFSTDFPGGTFPGGEGQVFHFLDVVFLPVAVKHIRRRW